jgi:Domain of unknown function (DUF1905)
MPKAVRSKAIASIQHFAAPLERLPSRLQWTIVYIGFDAGKVWGLRGQIKVKGEINGFPFRSSLFPTRQGRHFLLINKGMQRGAGLAEGKVARLAIELDREENRGSSHSTNPHSQARSIASAVVRRSELLHPKRHRKVDQGTEER